MRKASRLVALAIFLPALALARGGGGFGGGGHAFSAPHSFSGGSHSYSAPSHPSAPSRSYTAPSAPSRGGGTSYSAPAGGTSGTSSGGFHSNVDGAAGAAANRSASATAFRAANPQAWAKPQVADRISVIPSATISTRPQRSTVVFGTYYSTPPPVWISTPYSDPFGNVWFWMWLMDNAHQNERDRWVYAHRDEMDSSRYEQLKANDAGLEDRIAALEAQGVPRDPNYTPPGIDPDLQYGDDAIKSVHGSGWRKYVAAGLLLAVGVAGLYAYRRAA